MKFRKQKLPDAPPLRRRPVETQQRTPQAFSYYASRSSAPTLDRQTHRADVLPKRSRREILQYLLQRFGAVLSLLAVAVLLISSVQVSMNPKVEVLNEADSYLLHPISTYEQSAEQLLKSSWVNSNKITINTDRIAHELQTQYPELAAVSVTLPLVGQRPIIYLQLTEPRLVMATPAGQAFVLDENGRVLSPASQVTNLGRFHLATVTDQSGLQVKLGELVISRSSVRFITNVLAQLKDSDIPVGQLVLVGGSEEFDVHVLDAPYFVKFNLHEADTARQQTGTFLAVRSHLQKQGTVPAQYIDVRIPGRAYYK